MISHVPIAYVLRMPSVVLWNLACSFEVYIVLWYVSYLVTVQKPHCPFPPQLILLLEISFEFDTK